MSNKAFLFLAVLAIALGGALGGILLVVLDDTDEDPAPIASIAGPGGAGDGPEFERLTELGGRVESGNVDLDDLEELGELVGQFPGGSSGGGLLGGADGPSMIGTVQALDGNRLLLDTPVGPLEATVGDDTAIRSISEAEGTLEELISGLRVTITGERNEEGLLEATSVRVVPEGLQIPQRGQFAGQLEPGVLAGLAALSPEERNALALQASLMAAGARASGSVAVESFEEGVTVITEVRPLAGGEAPAGPPAGALTIPGRSRTFSFTDPSQDGGAVASSLTGVVASVADGILELTTPRGPVRASITPDTAISIFSETDGALDDLTAGVQVLISGQPHETGNLLATSITVIPESLAVPVGGPFGGPGAGFGGGRGGFGGGRPGAGQ